MVDRFVCLSEAGRHLGVPRQRIAALIARGELRGHRSPWDRRVRLVRLSELEGLRVRAEETSPVA